MPNSRLFRPRSGGGGGAGGVILSDHGTPLGTVNSIDVQGADIQASISSPGNGVITSPPPPPPTFGYWAGGSQFGFGASSTNDRLDFAADNVAMVTKGALAAPSNSVMGCNSSVKGYFGRLSANRLDSLIFAADSVAMTAINTFPTANVSSAGAAANSANRAYFGVFAPGVLVDTTYGISFASDTTAMTTNSVLTTERQDVSACNSSLAGYFAGGFIALGPVIYDLCDKLDYANDVAPMTAAGALIGNRIFQGSANSTTHGYWSGGQSGATPASMTNTTSRLDFAADAVAMIARGNLTAFTRNLAGANSTLKAYFAGGNDGFTQVSVNNGLTFATDSVAMVTRGALSSQRSNPGACQSGGIL